MREHEAEHAVAHVQAQVVAASWHDKAHGSTESGTVDGEAQPLLVDAGGARTGEAGAAEQSRHHVPGKEQRHSAHDPAFQNPFKANARIPGITMAFSVAPFRDGPRTVGY